MNAAQVNSSPAPLDTAESLPLSETLSALVDGELDVGQLPALFSALEQRQSEAMATWHAYQLVGDSLRAEQALTTQVPACDFLAAIRERLQQQDASVASIAHVDPSVRIEHAPTARPAANDAVFRWKLVAGLASLAAVTAVSWSVLSSTPRGAGNQPSPQLASVSTAEEPVVAGVARSSAPATAAVVVDTGQGKLIRDARLEQLLAEHRQNGGMSALQMPSGFIRNATYESEGR